MPDIEKGSCITLRRERLPPCKKFTGYDNWFISIDLGYTYNSA
jgi:hypothetical protein